MIKTLKNCINAIMDSILLEHKHRDIGISVAENQKVNP